MLRLSVVEEDCASVEKWLLARCSLSSCICNFTEFSSLASETTIVSSTLQLL